MQVKQEDKVDNSELAMLLVIWNHGGIPNIPVSEFFNGGA